VAAGVRGLPEPFSFENRFFWFFPFALSRDSVLLVEKLRVIMAQLDGIAKSESAATAMRTK